MDITLGTCSLCGGEVRGPGIWHGICPPPVSCSQCGAEPAQHGKIIEMTPPTRYTYKNVRVTSGTTVDPNEFKPTNTSGSTLCI